MVLSWILSATSKYAILPIAQMSWADSDIGAVLRAGEKTKSVAPAAPGTRARTIDVDFPDIRFRGFRNAVIAADFSGLIKDNRLLLPDDIYAHRDRIFGSTSNHLCPEYNDEMALVRRRNPTRIENGIFLGGLGSFNWYHWLIEILPKAMLVGLLPAGLRDYPLLVPPKFAGYPTFHQALETLQLTNEVIILKPGQAYRLGHVIFIDPATTTPFNMRDGFWPELSDNTCNSEALLEFRNRILTGLNLPTPEPKRRIFLARSNTLRVYNQDEIAGMLAEFGVESVNMDKLDFRQQVQLLREAELVIGPSGAAWANLIFAQVGAKGIIWTFPEYSEAASYSNLAETVGVELDYLFFPAKSSASTTHDLHKAGYDVDLAELRETVRRAIDRKSPLCNESKST